MKDTIKSSTSATYLDSLLDIDIDGRLTTHLCGRLGDFSFFIFDFPYFFGGAPKSSGYGVFVYRLVCCAVLVLRVSVLDRGRLPTNRFDLNICQCIDIRRD